jgi:RNA polymerase sigma-70 factor (ECF subfamily)
MQVSDEKRAGVETTLIGAVGAGDRHAFETLYRTYNHRLHQYLRMLLRDEAQVEEVVVETMVAVWSGAKTFRGGSQVSTWIFGIARHKALDALRRMTRADRRSVSLDDLLEQADPHDGPEVAAEQESLARVTQRALAALSAAHQEAIRLAYYEELSYEEMASVVGCPINTIKSRLFKAKQQLKQSLERLGLRTEMR